MTEEKEKNVLETLRKAWYEYLVEIFFTNYKEKLV